MSALTSFTSMSSGRLCCADCCARSDQRLDEAWPQAARGLNARNAHTSPHCEATWGSRTSPASLQTFPQGMPQMICSRRLAFRPMSEGGRALEQVKPVGLQPTDRHTQAQTPVICFPRRRRPARKRGHRVDPFRWREWRDRRSCKRSVCPTTRTP
jgi:hypothetical protein